MAGGRKGRRGEPSPLRASEHPFVGSLKAGGMLRPGVVFALGPRCGGAAVRSRIKRLLREAFRNVSLDFPKDSQVRIAATADLTDIPRRIVRAAGTAILQRLIVQWQGRQAHPKSSPKHS